MHDDIGNLLEVDTQEVYELFWLHVFRYAGEPCDI